MYNTVNFSQFCDSFSGGYKDNFTYEGKRALFDYIEELEESGDIEEIELDPIALCSEYSEFDDLKEIQKQYSDIKSIDDLKNQTTVIEVGSTGRIITQDY